MTPAEHGRAVIDAIIHAAKEHDQLTNLTLRVPDSTAGDLCPDVQIGGRSVAGQDMWYKGTMLIATPRIKSYDMIEVVNKG